MSDLTMLKLDASTSDFSQQLRQLLAWDETDDLDIQMRVSVSYTHLTLPTSP
jgi:histidinol dehydrogenase